MGLRISRDVAARLARSGLTLDAGRPLTLGSAAEARALAAALSATGLETPIAAGRLRATVELARILRRRLERYLVVHGRALEALLERLERRLGRRRLERALQTLERLLGASEPVDGEDPGRADEVDPLALLLESMVAFAVESNPATAEVGRALRSPALADDPDARSLLEGLAEELAAAPPLDEASANLRDSLLSPAALGGSLTDQLHGALDGWRDLEPEERGGLVAGLDLIAEEEAPRFPPGPGPIELPEYDDFEDEEPCYSTDLHWMEPLVLMAKNSYVWLEQLSRRYEREIARLDQIPDRELESLSRQGVSGLWLIGIWARSRASAEIKRLMGNPEALASAYSVREYRIARELGGGEAAAELAERAREHGIRLAADMVPNHMGIDSNWLLEHPERFLTVERCPFPNYTFEGPDLSPDPNVGIYLEDHYYDRSDAAVVFKRVDRRSGETRYVYHGNDGTSTPWNDTAQLDYLNPRTRAAVIETILGVAESFPIIRFDAAMTLARRHVRRLWFPEPGSGGAIPSRSDHALSQKAFDRALPTEFWRDVVGRVAAERPDTLLLAEAFWLMESYFVRSLGMHRVYNSAFMHLLRDGEVAKLRSMIADTVDFDPEILKRFVNFLSNPDEETAIGQFGDGDRYFGACVTLATLPGLPLFAHGQLEGLRERYGMEYRRAKLDERPDPTVVRRHRRQIVPLLRRRSWFAGVEHFALLAFEGDGGEQVLAYVNGTETEVSLAIFNNADRPVRGVLRGVEKLLEASADEVYRCRDLTARSIYLLESRAVADGGLRVELGPWESRVLVDFRPVMRAVEEPYRTLSRRLAGRGVENLELELDLLEYVPLVEATATFLKAATAAPSRSPQLEAVVDAARAVRADVDARGLREGLAGVASLSRLDTAAKALPWPSTERMRDSRRRLLSRFAAEGDLGRLRCLAAVGALRAALGEALGEPLWQRSLAELMRLVGAGDGIDGPSDAAVLGLALESGWLAAAEPPGRVELLSLLASWLQREDAPLLLGVNRYDGEEWVRKEQVELLFDWWALTAISGWLATGRPPAETSEPAFGWLEVADLTKRLFESSGYALGRFRKRLGRGRRRDGGATTKARPRASRGRRRRRPTNRPS